MSVYFIHHSGHIKIGISVDPWGRLSSLQTAHHEPLEMLAVMPGGRAEELGLHRRFAQLRVNREWFRDNDGLRQYIRQVREEHPDLQAPPRRPVVAEVQCTPELSDEKLAKICARFNEFIQAGGQVDFREDGKWLIIGLPSAEWTGKNTPNELCTVRYDDGRITPKINREVKPRTLTDRLNSVLTAIIYFYDPDLFSTENYGIALRFRKAPAPTEATP